MHMLIYAGHFGHYAGHHTGMGWFGQTVMTGVIHAAIYGAVYHLFKGLGLVGSLFMAALLLGGAYAYYRYANRD